jgi:hypothetical protein
LTLLIGFCRPSTSASSRSNEIRRPAPRSTARFDALCSAAFPSAVSTSSTQQRSWCSGAFTGTATRRSGRVGSTHNCHIDPSVESVTALAFCASAAPAPPAGHVGR